MIIPSFLFRPDWYWSEITLCFSSIWVILLPFSIGQKVWAQTGGVLKTCWIWGSGWSGANNIDHELQVHQFSIWHKSWCVQLQKRCLPQFTFIKYCTWSRSIIISGFRLWVSKHKWSDYCCCMEHSQCVYVYSSINVNTFWQRLRAVFASSDGQCSDFF